MYRIAQAEQPHAGTQLIQRVDWSSGGAGFGSYYGTPTYFATPAGQSGILGLGRCGCGCGGRCGVGTFTMDGTGLFGTGLFAGGMDFSTWGPGEYAVSAIGAYILYSVLFTTRSGYQQARKKVSAFRKA